jgi:trans-aconitate 2-methyltransferase
MRWEPGQYGRFAGPRLRPGIDLLARVPLEGAASVVDLGCGSGALFPALRARFPGAELTGVDNSPEMLAQAHRVDEGATLVEADAASWRPDRPPVDVIFSNALLHWVPDHAKLLPALLGSCRVLVVQMPANFAAPSHQLIGEIAARPRWVDRLGGIRLGEHVLGLPAYRRLLAPLAAEVDLVEADAATWRPEEPVDLIFSNAALHWLPDHAALLPRLLRSCRVLAVQMPANFGAALAPTRRRDRRPAALGRRLGGIRPGEHVLDPAEYRRLLAPLSAEVDLWETVYWHVLEGARPGARVGEGHDPPPGPRGARRCGGRRGPGLHRRVRPRRSAPPTRPSPTGARCSRSGACSWSLQARRAAPPALRRPVPPYWPADQSSRCLALAFGKRPAAPMRCFSGQLK